MGIGQGQIASVRYEMLGRNGGSGNAIAADASANVKGAYGTIGTASFDYDGFYLTNGRSSVGSSGGAYRVDIAVNNGGSDQIICEDIFIEGNSTIWFQQAPGPIKIPVRVPSGAIVKARCQSSAGGDWIYPTILGVSGDSRLQRGFSALRSATDWTNTAPTNSGFTGSGSTLTGWVEVCASTSGSFAALYLGLALKGSNSTVVDTIFDVATGAAASEIQLFSVHGYDDSFNQVVGAMCGQPAGPYPVDIPAGTRLSVRAQSCLAGYLGAVYPTLWGLAP